MRHSLFPVLALLLLSSCGSGGEAASDSAPGRRGKPSAAENGASSQAGLWGMLDKSLRRRRGAAREVRYDPEQAAASLPPGWKRTIDEAWQAWWKRAEDWPRKKAAWLALGPDAERILVENLIRYYVIAWDHGAEPDIRRTEREILQHQPLTATYLLEALAGGFGDDVVRNIIGELFSRFDPDVVPRIVAACDEAGPRGRRSLVRVLKKMRAPAALPLLIDVAGGDDPWQVRIEAISALGDMKAREAAPVLRRCLEDPNGSVRKFAVRSIAQVRDTSPETLEALVACMDRSLEESNLEVVRLCNAALRRLTGQRFGADPRVWRAWMKRQRRD